MQNRLYLRTILVAACSAIGLLLSPVPASASSVALSSAMAQYSVLGTSPSLDGQISFAGNIGVFAGAACFCITPRYRAR